MFCSVIGTLSVTVFSDKKAPVDQAFREHLRILVASEADTEELRALLDFSVSCALADACSQSVPFLLFADAYDSATIVRCQEIFELMEDRVAILKQGPLYRYGKTALLRMCNDLLRRLSKSQDTVFCGRILLFLARLLPLDEKSGLNLMSNFNLELGPPPYSSKSDKVSPADLPQVLDALVDAMSDDGSPAKVKSSKSETEEAKAENDGGGLQVDFSLYTKFWSLQEMLRNPNLCYEKQHWQQFAANAVDVLTTFSAFKLDDVPQHNCKVASESAAATPINEERRKGDVEKSAGDGETFFAKYLTSEKLLDLQLMDGHFRRYIFCQLLILFQYLNAPIKFKTAEQVLTDEQANWVRQRTEEVHQLIRETPPNGEDFLKFVLHALHREEFWSQWKNDGCATFIRTVMTSSTPPAPRKRKANPLLDREGRKIFRFAHSEINRLWNLCPDNFEAARNRERRYTPSVMTYFAEAIEQADPEQCVEEEYKHVNNEGWNWRALRLMARRSSQFFASSTVPGRKLRDYMDNIVKRAAASRPAPAPSKSEDGECATENDKPSDTDMGSASQPCSPGGPAETPNTEPPADD